MGDHNELLLVWDGWDLSEVSDLIELNTLVLLVFEEDRVHLLVEFSVFTSNNVESQTVPT